MKAFNDFIASLPSRDEMRQSGQAARMSADDGVTPEAGGVYTVSPCFKFGDRSWTEDLWRVVDVSGPNVVVQILRAKVVRVFRADERAWYPVSDATLALFLRRDTTPEATQ